MVLLCSFSTEMGVNDPVRNNVIIQQGVPGDAVPLPEREVSSLHLHFFSCAACGAKRVPE